KGNIALYYRSPPAIVMDFMKGGTAKKLIEDPAYEPLYYSEKWGGIVVMLGQMMAQALDMVHKAGFVHLDVKPQNVLFTSKPPLTGQDMLEQMVAGSLVPKIDPKFSAIIPVLKDMLAKDPERRPEAEKVANSLQKLVDKHGRLG